MRGRQVQIVALLGQARKLQMRAEVVRIGLERLRPSGDSVAQRAVDVLESLLGCRARSLVARLAHAVENPPGLDALFGLIAKEGVFQSGVEVVRLQANRGGKLLTSRLGRACFQIGVGQVLTNVSLIRSLLDNLLEPRDSSVVVLGPQSLISLVEQGHVLSRKDRRKN